MLVTGSDALASLVGASATTELGLLVARRAAPLFQEDISKHEAELSNRIGGQRILVVGGGGSIGSATTALLLKYAPAAVHVVDISENYLVELVRTLRGRPEGVGDTELKTVALDYGGPIMARMLAASKPFNIVLNFAALKHVRSEKDVFSLLQMLQTNVVAHARFKENLARWNHGRSYFAVSTDKAANPTSLMGASKRLMEDIAFEVAVSHADRTTSTRFANVAFSNGSLLQGFLQRLAKGQPIAAPRDTRRYFVTEEEAGQLCLIAAFLTPDQHITIPRLAPDRELQLLQDVAARVIEAFGYTPELYDDESKAKCDVVMLRTKRRWPLLMTPLDTSGEKPFEEFVGEDEQVTDIGFGSVLAVPHLPSRAEHAVLLETLGMLIEQPHQDAAKADVVRAIKAVLPSFAHRETGRNLDERL